MADYVTTDVEKRLDVIMSQYGDPVVSRCIQQQFRELAMRLQWQGISYELIAYSIAQHASATVAAMKMKGVIHPELADALGEDFVETLQRAHPGARQLASKP